MGKSTLTICSLSIPQKALYNLYNLYVLGTWWHNFRVQYFQGNPRFLFGSLHKKILWSYFIIFLTFNHVKMYDTFSSGNQKKTSKAYLKPPFLINTKKNSQWSQWSPGPVACTNVSTGCLNCGDGLNGSSAYMQQLPARKAWGRSPEVTFFGVPGDWSS